MYDSIHELQAYSSSTTKPLVIAMESLQSSNPKTVILWVGKSYPPEMLKEMVFFQTQHILYIRGVPKHRGTPKSSIFIGCFLVKASILVYPLI